MNKQTAIKAPTVADALAEIDARKERNIAQRLNACMAEVDYIQKEKKSGMNYSIVSHDAVTAKVRPILQAHGVVYYPKDFHAQQSGNRTELVFTVRFENIDNREDFIDVATMGFGVDQQDKGPGKAISYGVKYALLKVLGLETGDDPDEVQDDRARHEPIAGEVRTISNTRDDPFPQGPAKNKTELKTMGRAFWRDVEACGDSDELECCLADKNNRLIVKQLIEALPTWWTGGTRDGEAFEGLEAVIARKRKEFESDEQEFAAATLGEERNNR